MSNLVHVETGEIVSRVPAVPDPATSTIEAMREACLAVRTWADDCDNIEAGHEVLDRVLMVESYLSRKHQAAEAQEAARWLEVRIGELLGQAVRGGDRRSDQVNRDSFDDGLTAQERHAFRILAEYRKVVAELVPNSRRRILRVIRDLQAAANRDNGDHADLAEPEIEIHHGDFRDRLADLTDVDAIITDPPYPKQFLPLLGDLAAWADKALAPDGILAVLIGQTWLPDVYRLLDGHRPYRWTGCYLTTGPAYVSHPRRVQSQWKPLLVYGGGPRFSDVIASTGDDKEHHYWGQNYDAFHTIIERLTEPGQLVADPFMGGGTTLLAARDLGRDAIGCDIDEAAVATARRRLHG